MDKVKRGLGRGLSSLIGETKLEPQKNHLAISDLTPNKFQPRKIFDESNLEDLTNSIKERGMIQPIIVRKSNTIDNKYEIIAGERRWLAAQKVGLHNVPVVITEADDLKSLEFAIVENVQRHDLNPLEEAQGYKKLINEFSYDHEKVSKFIGKSRSYITNSLRILTLPEEVIKLMNDNQYGLSSGVYTSDLARGMRVSNAIRAGITFVNTYRLISPSAPFGGIKDSGYGKEAGIDSIKDYTRVKTTWFYTSDEPSLDPFSIR